MGGGGGARFRKLRGQGGGGKVFAGCKPFGAPAPNQCQIITLLTLKTDAGPRSAIGRAPDS